MASQQELDWGCEAAGEAKPRQPHAEYHEAEDPPEDWDPAHSQVPSGMPDPPSAPGPGDGGAMSEVEGDIPDEPAVEAVAIEAPVGHGMTEEPATPAFQAGLGEPGPGTHSESLEPAAGIFIDDVQEVEDVPIPELLARARSHLVETSCTEFSEATHKFEYIPLCGTGPSQLGRYGVGVQLYFQFICQAGFLLLFMFIISTPALAFNILGSMVDESNPFYDALGTLSIANLGNCPSAGCLTDDDRRNRCAIRDSDPCQQGYKVSDITQWLGLLDGITILCFVAFGVFFNSVWIPRAIRKNDSKHTTVADFTVEIKKLPRKLACEHEKYEEKLREHFLNVLRSTQGFLEEPDAIQEVVLVREYHGGISRFMYKGSLQEELKAARILLERAKKEGQEASKIEKRQKAVESAKKSIQKVDAKLRKQANLADEEREVCEAFVMFKREAYKEAVLHEYRFSAWFWFRCCQGSRLRFEGTPITMSEATEPSNIIWENMDFSNRWRLVRKAVILLLSFVILIGCSLLLVYFQSIQRSTTSAPPESTAWILAPSNRSDPMCLTLCDFTVFEDEVCLETGRSSLQASWNATLFDANGDLSASSKFPTPGDCSKRVWKSPACGSAAKDPVNDWIGLRFSTPHLASCVKALQAMGNVTKELQLFACRKDINFTNLAHWDPAVECQAMTAVKPMTLARTAAPAGVPTGAMKQVLDTTCAAPISYTTAQMAKSADTDALQDLTYWCYCKQQVKVKGVTFRLPPFTTDEQRLCEPWSMEQNTKFARTVGAVVAVLILNQLLLLIYSYFIEWERHCTVTDMTTSQMWKLFLGQFVNTGVLTLLVNANLKDIPPAWRWIRVLQIGEGTYDDLSPSWFVSVGSGVILTIFSQVFSTTVTPLVFSFIVTPIYIRVFRGCAVTQEQMNRLYTLPPWDLSLRLAQSMNIIFVCVMYASGMPIMYAIAFVYCIVAYWLDKWCLLRGSCQPPAYKHHVIVTCLNLFPFAAFVHSAVGGWTLGKQALWPSNWSQLRWIAEAIFGITVDEYDYVVTNYPTASAERQNSLQRQYYRARLLDFAREGCWLLMLIFLAFSAIYIVYYVWHGVLAPLLRPVVFVIREICSRCCPGACGCCRSRADQFSRKSIAEEIKEWEQSNILSSYKMAANNKYRSAAAALASTTGKATERENH